MNQKVVDVTPDAVWEALLRHPEFEYMPDEQKEIIKPRIQHLPELLSDMLSEAATVQRIMDASAKFIRYQIEDGVFDELAESTGFDFGMAVEAAEISVEMIEETDFAAFLDEYGIEERHAMAMPTSSNGLGLPAEVMEIYDAGELTIGRLLVTWPAAIVKNTQ